MAGNGLGLKFQLYRHNSFQFWDDQLQQATEDIQLCFASCHGQPGYVEESPVGRLIPVDR